MGILGFILLGLALAMDCFSVSITCGLIQKRMGRQVWAMALLFGFFQAMMPFIGWLAIAFFADKIEAYDHWIAFGLLLFLGGRMIVNGLRHHDDAAASHFNPSDWKVLLTLAVATSIDALAVGFTFVGMGIHHLGDACLPTFIIGVMSAVMSVMGKYIGVFVGRRLTLPAEPLGGLILIIIGVKVLVEHLCG
jgi:putative Mn2+ efflux pump MntP